MYCDSKSRVYSIKVLYSIGRLSLVIWLGCASAGHACTTEYYLERKQFSG